MATQFGEHSEIQPHLHVQLYADGEIVRIIWFQKRETEYDNISSLNMQLDNISLV